MLHDKKVIREELQLGVLCVHHSCVVAESNHRVRISPREYLGVAEIVFISFLQKHEGTRQVM